MLRLQFPPPAAASAPRIRSSVRAGRTSGRHSGCQSLLSWPAPSSSENRPRYDPAQPPEFAIVAALAGRSSAGLNPAFRYVRRLSSVTVPGIGLQGNLRILFKLKMLPQAFQNLRGPLPQEEGKAFRRRRRQRSPSGPVRTDACPRIAVFQSPASAPPHISSVFPVLAGNDRKSQYPHFRAQNGIWTYSSSSFFIPVPFSDSRRHKGNGGAASAAPPRLFYLSSSFSTLMNAFCGISTFPHLAHALLAFLLFFQQLLLPADIAAVALGQHVLSQRLYRLSGDDFGTDGRLGSGSRKAAAESLPSAFRTSSVPVHRRSLQKR